MDIQLAKYLEMKIMKQDVVSAKVEVQIKMSGSIKEWDKSNLFVSAVAVGKTKI